MKFPILSNLMVSHFFSFVLKHINIIDLFSSNMKSSEAGVLVMNQEIYALLMVITFVRSNLLSWVVAKHM